MSKKSVLSILGVTANEDVNTRLLRHAIETEPTFRDEFATRVLGWPKPTPQASVAAFDQVAIHVGRRGRRLDLVVVMQDAGVVWLSIVENKLMSGEGEDQTADYAKPEAVASLVTVLNKKPGLKIPTDITPTMHYLVLHEGERASSEAFKTVRHKQVACAVAVCSGSIADKFTGVLLDDWREHVETFERTASEANFELPLPALFPEAAPELDSSYSIFGRIAEQVANRATAGLPRKIEHSLYRGAGQGRSWYGAAFWQRHWVEQAVEGHLARSLHFQLTWNPLDRLASLTLHHETNPYLPQSVAKAEFAADIKRYIDARKSCVQALMVLLGPIGKWKRGGTWNICAKHVGVSQFVNQPTSAFIDDIARCICEASPSVEALVSSAAA